MFFPSKSWCFLNPNTYNVTWSAKQTKTNQKWQHFRGGNCLFEAKVLFCVNPRIRFQFFVDTNAWVKIRHKIFQEPIIVVHGGAWSIPDHMETVSREGVKNAAKAGYNVLLSGEVHYLLFVYEILRQGFAVFLQNH